MLFNENQKRHKRSVGEVRAGYYNLKQAVHIVIIELLSVDKNLVFGRAMFIGRLLVRLDYALCTGSTLTTLIKLK